MDSRSICLKRVSVSRHRSLFLMGFMAENPYRPLSRKKTPLQSRVRLETL